MTGSEDPLRLRSCFCFSRVWRTINSLIFFFACLTCAAQTSLLVTAKESVGACPRAVCFERATQNHFITATPFTGATTHCRSCAQTKPGLFATFFGMPPEVAPAPPPPSPPLAQKLLNVLREWVASSARGARCGFTLQKVSSPCGGCTRVLGATYAKEKKCYRV